MAVNAFVSYPVGIANEALTLLRRGSSHSSPYTQGRESNENVEMALGRWLGPYIRNFAHHIVQFLIVGSGVILANSIQRPFIVFYMNLRMSQATRGHLLHQC